MTGQRTALLSTTYFGPVQWYQKLHRYGEVRLECHDHFVKQTYRNRCLIASAQGVQALTVPVIHDGTADIRDVRISDHGNWRHLHWNALCSAYGDSPFFEFYADDLAPFFERRWTFLLDFNEEIMAMMCRLLDIHPHITPTEVYWSAEMVEREGNTDDFREVIRPKHPLPDADFLPKRYYQVFEQKQGFLPNLSILDLLMNEGNESIFYL
ncbi:MAG: WbqC family protein [Prevotella sp.]|nr:WbqC family protein [Prevotella sp.]